jgi:hypothetical protein
MKTPNQQQYAERIAAAAEQYARAAEELAAVLRNFQAGPRAVAEAQDALETARIAWDWDAHAAGLDLLAAADRQGTRAEPVAHGTEPTSSRFGGGNFSSRPRESAPKNIGPMSPMGPMTAEMALRSAMRHAIGIFHEYRRHFNGFPTHFFAAVDEIDQALTDRGTVPANLTSLLARRREQLAPDGYELPDEWRAALRKLDGAGRALSALIVARAEKGDGM